MTGASGQVTDFPQSRLTLVSLSGMPQVGSTNVYELWLIPDQGSPIPAGVFRPEIDGSKVLILSRDLKGLKALAVTREPAPYGSPQPTQTPQLAGNIY